MHGLPQGSGFNIFLFQGQSDILPGYTIRQGGIDKNTGKPPIGEKTRTFYQKRNSFYICQCFLIVTEICSSIYNSIGQNSHLPPSNTSKHIAHSIIVADVGMLVMRCRVSGLGGKKSGFLYPILVVRNQSPTARSGNNFISIKRQNSHIPKTTHHLAIPVASKCFCGIFNYQNVVFFSNYLKLIHLSRHSVQMDQNHCPWHLAFC